MEMQKNSDKNRYKKNRSIANKMRIFKTIRLVGSFYKSFLLASMLITACCLGIFWEYGYSIFSKLFWFKLSTLGLICYFINSYKSKEYYYYLNLGISKVLLWSSILIFDFAFFLFLIIQVYKIR